MRYGSLSNVRLRYSGMLLFISRLLSIITGMLFTMIVTRRLTVVEFGTWQYMNVLFAYFMIPTGFTSLWVTRQVARGEKVATTGLLLNILFSIPLTALFIAIAVPASEAVDISPMLFLVISPQITLLYLLALFESISSGIKPYLLGYGSIFFELVKIGIGIILVLDMRLGLMGALLSIEGAYILQDLFMALVLRREFTRSFSRETARKWLMLVWIPLFSSLAIQLQQLDSLIIMAIVGSTIPIAMLKAAQVFSTVVSFSSFACSALYPRLLAREDRKDVEITIRLISFLAIPIMVGAIVLAEPLLAVLRIDYVGAAMALRIGVVTTAMVSMTNIAETIISATEKIDISRDVNFLRYLRSRLALTPILSLLYDVAYLTIVFIIVSYFTSIHVPAASIVTAMALAALLVYIPIVAYKWRLARRLVSFKFPTRSIASYAIAAVAMAIVIVLSNPLEAVSTEVMRVVYGVIPRIAIGGIVFFLLSAVLDKEPRIIVKGFLREIKLID